MQQSINDVVSLGADGLVEVRAAVT